LLPALSSCILLLLLLASRASACERCVRQGKAAYSPFTIPTGKNPVPRSQWQAQISRDCGFCFLPGKILSVVWFLAWLIRRWDLGMVLLLRCCCKPATRACRYSSLLHIAAVGHLQRSFLKVSSNMNPLIHKVQ
jgi:hypothetical protein